MLISDTTPCQRRESSPPQQASTLAESPNRPKRRSVSAILATSDEQFRNRVLERLLAAGYDDLEVAELPAALADLLRDTEQPLVVVGGTWPAPQPFLRVAVNAGALPLVLLDSSALEAEGEALAMGARAALQSDIPTTSLAAALAAVDAGLLVLEPSARALLLSPNRDPLSHGRDLWSPGPDSLSPAQDLPLPRQDLPSSRRGLRTPGQNLTSPHRDSRTPIRGRESDLEATSSVEAPEHRRNARPLTARERQILALVASGTSNKGIARALSVSANTVKFHLAAVFDKLNAGTRAEAVTEAIRRGELSL